MLLLVNHIHEKTSQWVKTDKILGVGAICNLHLFYNFACMLHDNRIIIIIIIIIIKIKTLSIDLKKLDYLQIQEYEY